MNVIKNLIFLSALFVLISLVHSNTIDTNLEENDISNVQIDDEKRPLFELLTKVENFVENSLHALISDFFLKNDTVRDHVATLFSFSVHAFHNFSTEIDKYGDQLFKRQERIINLIKCECPDSQKKCEHIIKEAKSGIEDVDKKVRDSNEEEPLPFVDIYNLIKHFQSHFSNVFSTQRKVFEYATCACPAKRDCVANKLIEVQDDDNEETIQQNFSKVIDKNGPLKKKIENELQNNKNQDTTFFNGILPSGAHIQGESFHTSNSNGYVFTTEQNFTKGMDKTEPLKKKIENENKDVTKDSLKEKLLRVSKRSLPNESADATNKGYTKSINTIYSKPEALAGDPQPRGFFSDFFHWFTNIFSNDTPPNGTILYNGTTPDGAHYSGGEFHNGNTNGYFISTHKNDSNGNFYSASSSSGGGFTFG